MPLARFRTAFRATQHAGVLCAVAAVAALSGCKSHETAYMFTQTDGIAELTHQGARAGSVEAVMLGARDATAGSPPLIDVRLRLSRAGTATVAVAPEDLEIVTSGNQRLRVHQARTRGPSVAAVGGAVTWEMAFAIERPATLGGVDFTRMDLAVPVEIDGDRRVVALTFRRDLPVHPWADPWDRTPLAKP